MRQRLTLLVMALVMALMLAFAGMALAAQPQSGQPGLTEGQNGPPPFPQAFHTH